MFQEYSKEIRKFFKAGILLAFMLTFFLAVLSVVALKEYKHIGEGVYPAKTLSISGSGEVYAVPDIAQFTFTVTETEDIMSDAQKSVTEKIDAAIKVLTDAGIEDKDIKTTNYNAYPKYTYPETICYNGICPSRERVLSGYTVSQGISVKIREVEQAGDILGAVTETGVSNVSGLSFVIDDEDALRTEARAKAIADAHDKIDVLAKELGVKIKGVTGFYESNGYDYPRPEYALSAKGGVYSEDSAVSASIPSGENLIKIQVDVIYEIE